MEKLYRVRVVLKSGAVVEADVADLPQVEVRDGEIQGFDWKQPKDETDGQRMVFVRNEEIAAVTYREVSTKKAGFGSI